MEMMGVYCYGNDACNGDDRHKDEVAACRQERQHNVCARHCRNYSQNFRLYCGDGNFHSRLHTRLFTLPIFTYALDQFWRRILAFNLRLSIMVNMLTDG